jgi:SAM-dependent methyltransferase
MQVLFCADCSMGVIGNPPASTDPYYPDGYYGRASSDDIGYVDYAFTAEHGLLWVQLMVQALARDGSRVLDVGCADGFLLHRLQGGYHRFGIEVNVAAQALARARGVTILGNDIMALGIGEGGPFDIITSIATFEHVLDFRGAVAVCLRQLAPGGVLLLEVPLISATRDNKDWYNGSYEHIFYPTIRGLERLFGSFDGLQFHGFESDIKGFSSSYIGAASYDPEAFARARTLLQAMYQPGLGGLDETGTRLNLAYHVVHSFRPNAERVLALPTLLAVAHTPNLLKRFTQLWYDDSVLADAWRNTEAMLTAGTNALRIAQTALDRLKQELVYRQQEIAAQQQEIAAQQQEIAAQQQEIAAQQQEIAAQQQALAAENLTFAESRAQCEATQREQATRLAAEAAAFATQRRQQEEELLAKQGDLAAQTAALESRMAVYRPLLRFRRAALAAVGRHD